MVDGKMKIDLEASSKGYKGSVVYRGLEFQWTLNSQKGGGFRGLVTVHDMYSGEKVSFIKKQPYAKKGSKEIRQEFRELNFRSNSEKEIKNYICNSIQSIYKDNELLFLRMLKMGVTPETITIGLACELFATEYINKTYPKDQEKTKVRYLAKLKEDLSNLSSKPMAYYSDHPSEAMRALNKAGVTTAAIKSISSFWDFAIYKGRYIQKNPITIPEADSKGKKTKDTKRLIIAPEDTMEYANQLMLKRHAGKDCGVALNRSGFSLVDACSFIWGDIVFPLLESRDSFDEFDEIEIEDFCVVLLERPNLMIAVHDYRRPIIIISAMVLYLRFKELLEKYDIEELIKLPVVSLDTDPCKAMSPKALQSAIKELLLEAGIEEKVLKHSKKTDRDPISSKLLLNTYETNLINKCKLKRNSGTYNYLLGRSLGDDVTSTNYASFSDDKAQFRLFRILRRMRQRCRIDSPPRALREENGREIATVSPDYTDEVAGDVLELVLQPGEEIVVSSLSGAQLDIKVIGTSAIEEEKDD